MDVFILTWPAAEGEDRRHCLWVMLGCHKAHTLGQWYSSFWLTHCELCVTRKHVNDTTHSHTRTRRRTHACAHTCTHLFYGPLDFVRDYPVKPIPEPIWILLKQETVSGSGISWAICQSAPCPRQITTPAPHNLVFYRPDGLPATKPTA